jgi:hypothetical protein
MATPSVKLALLLNSIEENCDSADYQDLWVPYMIDCASIMKGRMSPTAAAAFRVSKADAAAPNNLHAVDEAESAERSLARWRECRRGHPATR